MDSAYWIGVLFGVGLVVVALVFIVMNKGLSGDFTITIPPFKVEKGSHAVFVLCAGLVVGGLSLWQIQELQSSRALLGSVETVEQVSAGPSESILSAPEPSQLKWYATWLLDFYQRAQINIDKGSRHGVRKGDYFATTYEDKKKLRNLPRDQVGGLHNNVTTLLEVVEVFPRQSVCQLRELAYERYFDEVEKTSPEADLKYFTGPGAPVVQGQTVVGIPREEKGPRDEIERDFERASADGVTGAEKRFYMEDVLRRADEFFRDHNNPYFGPDILWDKGAAQFELKQYREARETFYSFLRRYPFHASAPGARDYLDKIDKVEKTAAGR